MNRRLFFQAFLPCTVVPCGEIADALQLIFPYLEEHPKPVAEPHNPEPILDPLYAQAVAIVMLNQKANISFVQRHLKLGYNRAARLLESMEHNGLIGTEYVNGYRQILTQC